MKNLFAFALIFSALVLTSCNNDDDSQPINPPEEAFSHGMFVLNEGGFGAGNATVSFLSNHGVLTHNIFNLVNGGAMGDVAQSMYFTDNLIFIVMNGSSKIEVVNRYTFESVKTITTGLVSPRYMAIENDKAFVTNWGDPGNPDDDFVAVINLNNFTVESTIPVAEGPEAIVENNGKLFVAQMGGWGYGNSVTVINAATKTVTATLPVGDIPESMEVENDMLYVLSSGKAAWTGDETKGSLVRIDLLTSNILNTIEFETGFHPTNLVEEDGVFYFTENANIYSTDVSSGTFNSLFSTTAQGVMGVYGFDVNDGKVFVADAGDYISAGTVYIYDLSGNLVDDFSAGLLPNGFGFND